MGYVKINTTDSPWEAACRLINAKIKVVNLFSETHEVPCFEVDELRKIGEHLLNYCNVEGGER